MIVTAVNEEINRLYGAMEPLAEEDARVCIFDLLVPAQDFLLEYVAFLVGRHLPPPAGPELESAAREQVRAAKAAKDAAMVAHAAARPSWPSAPLSQTTSRSSGATRRTWWQASKLPPNPNTAIDAAFEALLPSPEALMEHIARTDPIFTRQYLPSMRMHAGSLYAESIISSFLVYRFMQRRWDLMRRWGAAAGAVSIGFHGTIPELVSSICRHGPGLAKPGSGSLLGSGPAADGVADSVTKSCGAAFGSGIYLSPYASFSLRYGYFDRLFVCLVLRGRTREAKGSDTRPWDECDSFFDPTEREWIVFDNAAVLPVYLLRGKPIQSEGEDHDQAPSGVYVANAASSSMTSAKNKKANKGVNNPQSETKRKPRC